MGLMSLKDCLLLTSCSPESLSESSSYFASEVTSLGICLLGHSWPAKSFKGCSTPFLAISSIIVEVNLNPIRARIQQLLVILNDFQKSLKSKFF